MDRAALENLTVTLAEEPNNAAAWRLSAIAHGRLGNEAMTALALADSALARGKYEEPRGRAAHASGLLQENTAPWLHSPDRRNGDDHPLQRGHLQVRSAARPDIALLRPLLITRPYPTDG